MKTENLCECGEWSGVRCETRLGADAETVEFMPAYLRASHVAARNVGAYPDNGARRIRVSGSCASDMACDQLWVWRVSR